MTRRLY